MSNTVIIIPCHNEARRLNVGAFRRFAHRQANVKFLLVNDGSRDETLNVLNGMVAADPAHFEVLDLSPNGGKAEAVRRGFLHAARRQPNYIGFWDADLATPLAPIPAFIDVLNRTPELALVMGTRLPLLGHEIRRRPLRRWLGAEFCQVVSLVFGQKFHDTQCGAKLFRLTPETLAAFSLPFDSRWIFDVEFLARLRQLAPRSAAKSPWSYIYEFPLEQWDEVPGSNLKRGDFFKAFAELAAIWWRYLRPGAPQFVGKPIEFGEQPSEKRKAA